MLLYSFKITPNNRKVEAFVAHYELPIEIQQIDFKHKEHQTDEYFAINPMRKVPALIDGDFKLWESNAILTYLATQFPETKALPTDPQGRADADRWLHWQSCHLMPLMGAFKTGVEDDLNAVKPLFDTLEVGLQDKSYLLEHRLGGISVADFAVAAYLMTKLGHKLDYSGHSNVAAWRDRMVNTKGFLETQMQSFPAAS